MRNALLIGSTLFCVIAAGCNKAADDETKTAEDMAEAAGAPSSEAVAAAQASGGRDTGGLLTADISGGKTAHTEIRDIGYCVTKAPAPMDMTIFALAGNNSQWSVTISGTAGMPTVGTHKISGAAGDPLTYNASASDKTTGDQPAEWQQYEAGSGSVTFTSVAPAKLEGTFTFKAAPKYPQTTGAAVDVTGNFAVPQAEGCS